MKKIALIRSLSNSYWVSCQSIVDNLQSSYELTNNDIKIIHIEHGLDTLEAYKIADHLKKSSFDEIIFIDHRPHPKNLLFSLVKFFPDYKPDVTFHIYGDFLLNSLYWYQSNDCLSHFHVNFICASEKHAQLLESFLINPSSVSVTPFPVSDDDFYFDDKMRSKTRESLGLNEHDYVFLYTGRISLQKNVLELIKSFNSILEVNSCSYLFFAGPFDDLGIPYKGQENTPGSYFQRWIKLNNTISKDRISYLGNLNKSQLLKYYNASDCFISLSTHNDEDFGMSPAEASLTGLPLILTDWGGYSSFYSALRTTCTLLPVEYRNGRLVPNTRLLQKKIIQQTGNFLSNNNRQNFATQATKYFSIRNCSVSLAKRIDKNSSVPFNGFNSHFYSVSSHFKLNSKKPFIGSNGDYSELYFKTYKAYLKESLQ